MVKVLIEVPKGIFANLSKIKNGSIASKRILDCVKAGVKLSKTKQNGLILCENCKWFNTIGCAISIVDDSDKPTENDYCSFAEKR